MALMAYVGKDCFKCNTEKPLNEFYHHPAMAGGRLNKCKDCTKSDVSENYRARWNQYAEYERSRQQKPERRRKKLEYMRTTRRLNPEKYKARTAVGNAIRDGRLIRHPCIYCGSDKTEGHHMDYSKPLDVTWVCFKCHREVEHKQVV